MTLSIVITTFNRAPVLRRLLQGLVSQTDQDFQVVVAIDGSTDDTAGMLRSLRVPYDLKWADTRCRGYGLAVARNLGIIAADGPAVAILDDDSFPVDDFVSAHKRSVKPRVITGGPRDPADAGNERMRWKMRELGRLPPLVPMTLPRLREEWPNAYLIENNICMSRDDFIEMGLFSERLKMYGFIGQEFFARAEFLGLRYQYNPDAAIVHHGEFAGDNGLGSGRKARETRLSMLIRPSLMRPDHYRAQIAWARARSAGDVAPLPAYAHRAAMAFPFRALRMAAMGMKRTVHRLWHR